MSAVELQNVDDAVDQIMTELGTSSHKRATWTVLGEPTAGKSAVLESLHERLSASGTVRSVLITPPARAYDAGHAALVELAEGLSLNEHALNALRDPEVPWERKVARVRTALAREEQIVLLADEPAEWLPRRETYFRAFVRDVWDLVFDGHGNSTVSAGRAPVRIRGQHEIHLDPGSDPAGVLAAIDHPLLEGAKAAVRTRFEDRLAYVSPQQIRLLVAIGALRESSLDRIDPALVDHRAALVGTLIELVHSQHPTLRDVWLRLAAVREPFDEDLLGLAGARSLTPLESALATRCLLFRRRGRLVLHESLRGVGAIIGHEVEGRHELLAAYYRHRFDDPQAGVSSRMRDAIEAFHHASTAGIVQLETYRPFFVDQLNILGYHLSVERHELRRAADVFNVALQWDERNAYAAHYRAFNLDQLVGAPGVEVDPREVEALYRIAVEERPRHPWFRSRLINFLIAEARIDDAWSEWLSASEITGQDAPEYVYFGLHLHVARNFLYRGELEHAEAVLRSVPPDLATDERFSVIRDRLRALRESRDTGGSYVPAPFLAPRWWESPKLLPHASDVVRWWAARTCEVSSDAITLDVADINPGVPPVYGTVELPLHILRSWWRGPGEIDTLEVGEFLEVGFYSTEEDAPGLAIRHPRLPWPDLARPNEDPDRYLRAA